MFDLLRVLVENAGHLVEKDRLLKEVWADAFVEESNLNRGISVLRKALGETAAERYIETVPKRGYRFVAAVQVDTSESSEVVRHPDPESTAQPPIASPHALPIVALATGMAILAVAAYVGPGKSARESGTGVAASPVHRQVTFTGKEGTPALSPDGRQVAYVSKETPYRKVIVQEVAGGRSIELFSSSEAGALRWSPDGSELMLWARSDGVTAGCTSCQRVAEAHARSPLASLSDAGRLMAPPSPLGCSAPAKSCSSTSWENRSGRSRFEEAENGCGTWTGRRFTDGC